MRWNDMKILMLTSDVSLQCGIARHILKIAPVLNQERGVDVAVCTVLPHGPLSVALEAAGVKCYSLDSASGHSLLGVSRFANIMRAFRPDVVHVHVLALCERIYLRAFSTRVPVVMTCHGLTDLESGVRKPCLRDYLDAIVSRLFPPRVTRRIYISKGVQDYRGDRNGVVVYNPMDFRPDQVDKKHARLRLDLNVPDNVPLIGTACRICRQKCPELFTEVFCRVLQNRPNAHAVVCGTGDAGYMKRLVEIVDKFGVAERFHWLGYRADALDVIQALDCFVMTSATEGMPTALLEAMSVYTPIAFLRGIGGLVDLDNINENKGPIAVVTDNVPQLVTGVLELLDDPVRAHALAQNAHRVGAHYFDVTKVKDRLLSIYRGESSAL